jgi:hypothetical protein
MNNEQIGIEISQSDFDAKIARAIKVMSSRDSATIQDFIEFIRLHNTIEINNLENRKPYSVFKELFTTKYLELTIAKLEATLSKGMSYYSRKYDLYIGGKPHVNSMYKILKSN